jgi:predicted hydrocarbon binding protein
MTVGAALREDRKENDIRDRDERRGSRADIARRLRRSQRQFDNGAGHRRRIEQLRAEGASRRQAYGEGERAGSASQVRNLADVLYAVHQAGLGRAAVCEESNVHVLFRVEDCVCSRTNTDTGCAFVAGYLAGALAACGRYRDPRVSEQACQQPTRGSCVFRAELRLRS